MNRKMKRETRAVLDAAYRFWVRDSGWFRPKNIGGSATNRCACHLHALITRGFIERTEATEPTAWREKKLWKYRITLDGIAEVLGNEKRSAA